jgi:hypothetical protein
MGIKSFKSFRPIQENKEETNYMFFANLENICRMVTNIMEMDKDKIDEMLTDGHDWANDHISKSMESISHVYNFLHSSDIDAGLDDMEMDSEMDVDMDDDMEMDSDMDSEMDDDMEMDSEMDVDMDDDMEMDSDDSEMDSGMEEDEEIETEEEEEFLEERIKSFKNFKN